MYKNIIRSEYRMITPKDKVAYVYYKQQNVIVRLVGRRPVEYIVEIHTISDFRNTSHVVWIIS